MTELNLPNKPSELLCLAVHDCMVIEQNPKSGFKLNMSTWMELRGDTCFVCMAGAVMALTLKIERPSPGDNIRYPAAAQTEEIADKLRAIDLLRTGELGEACEILGLELETEVYKNYISLLGSSFVLQNGERVRRSWETYLEAADYLESVGL